MSHKLYVEIYNLITDSIGEYEEKLERELRDLDMSDHTDITECGHISLIVSRIKENRAKIKEYECLLERFEEEVKEPKR